MLQSSELSIIDFLAGYLNKVVLIKDR